MADPTPNSEEPKKRPAAVGGSPALADDGDVAFGAMAGMGVIAAILVSFFVATGIINLGGGDAVATSPTTVAESGAIDLPEISKHLDEAGFPGVNLAADGNIVFARGEVADLATKAAVVDFIRQEPYVEDVIDELTIAAPGGAAANIAVANDGITLSGTVPSEAVAQGLRDAAAQNYDAGQIDDQLTVAEGATSFTLTSSGSLSDPAKFRSLADGIVAAASTFDGTGSYTDGIELDAQVDASLNELVGLEPILFQSGTAIIDASSLPTIDRAAEVLKAFPDASVEIGGHTDNVGSLELNQNLSQARADAVLAALQERGVETNLTAVGYGPSQPLNDNATPEDRALNRRIQFTAL